MPSQPAPAVCGLKNLFCIRDKANDIVGYKRPQLSIRRHRSLHPLKRWFICTASIDYTMIWFGKGSNPHCTTLDITQKNVLSTFFHASYSTRKQLTCACIYIYQFELSTISTALSETLNLFYTEYEDREVSSSWPFATFIAIEVLYRAQIVYSFNSL